MLLLLSYAVAANLYVRKLIIGNLYWCSEINPILIFRKLNADTIRILEDCWKKAN